MKKRNRMGKKWGAVSHKIWNDNPDLMMFEMWDVFIDDYKLFPYKIWRIFLKNKRVVCSE